MTREPDISLSTERLLQCQEALGQLQEARAEIERLRREIGIWKALLAQYEKPETAPRPSGEIGKLLPQMLPRPGPPNQKPSNFKDLG